MYSHVSLVSIILCLTILTFQACKPPSNEVAFEEGPEFEGVLTEVLSQEEQAALSPDDVIAILKKGNIRFTNNNLTARDHSAQVRNSVDGQYPKAIVLSCIDSRIPVEDVFDRGIGDLFVARVAGNVVNTDILGSMEYGCKVAGSKLIVVLGHEHCGAVNAAIKDVQMGNITEMLAKIRPAVIQAKDSFPEGDIKNANYVHQVCVFNVQSAMAQIIEQSEILKTMIANGEIKIVGAVYDMDSGKVDFL